MEDNGPRLKISVCILLVMATVFMVARFYAKVTKGRGLWWDDHILLAAWCCLLVEVVCLNVITKYGYGKHSEELPPLTPGETEQYLLISTVSGTFGLLAVLFSKTSFAVTLLRITEGKVRIGVWVAIVTMNLFMGVSVLLIWIQCQPVNKIWQPFIEGNCWDVIQVTNYHIFSSAYSATADIVLAIVPWFLVMHIQMKPRERIGVAVAMSLGIFAGGTAVVKCVYLPVMEQPNFTFRGVNLSIWGTAESAVTITAASIPILRVYIRDAKSSLNKYYGHGTNAAGVDARGTRLRDGNHTLVVGGRDARAESRMDKGTTGDDGSERSILAYGKIIKTDEVAVEWKDKDDKDDSKDDVSTPGQREGSSYELRGLDV